MIVCALPEYFEKHLMSRRLCLLKRMYEAFETSSPYLLVDHPGSVEGI